MVSVTAVVGLAAMLAAALLTGLVRKFALARGVLDVPNRRSSHRQATPRGGGIAIVMSVTVALLFLAARGSLPRELLLALVGGGIAVAAVGFADDRYTVGAGPRLVIHFLAAAWAVYWLGGLENVRIGADIVHFGWVGGVLAMLGIVWFLNLFNFMDGIDGIATCEAVFIAAAGALLSGDSDGVAAAAWVFAASCAGFLPWNWPPAKIFMGDVGSGYLGYVLAVLGLGAAHQHAAAPWTWLILSAVFLLDASVTLTRRLLRGERVYEAHRSHAYQWLARRWGTHRRVTLAMLLLDMLWLLPCAVFATLHPSLAARTASVALAPVLALAVLAGSGRREAPGRPTSR
jgi:Fuc2NAc and GlcNAc transferase